MEQEMVDKKKGLNAAAATPNLVYNSTVDDVYSLCMQGFCRSYDNWQKDGSKRNSDKVFFLYFSCYISSNACSLKLIACLSIVELRQPRSNLEMMQCAFKK